LFAPFFSVSAWTSSSTTTTIAANTTIEKLEAVKMVKSLKLPESSDQSRNSELAVSRSALRTIWDWRLEEAHQRQTLEVLPHRLRESVLLESRSYLLYLPQATIRLWMAIKDVVIVNVEPLRPHFHKLAHRSHNPASPSRPNPKIPR
jgi:hypothetical protein